jgi:hypothetical protein
MTSPPSVRLLHRDYETETLDHFVPDETPWRDGLRQSGSFRGIDNTIGDVVGLGADEGSTFSLIEDHDDVTSFPTRSDRPFRDAEVETSNVVLFYRRDDADRTAIGSIDDRSWLKTVGHEPCEDVTG